MCLLFYTWNYQDSCAILFYRNMTFLDYFLDNYVMFFELLGLLIILFISAHISKKIKVYTRVTIGLLFFAIVVTYLEAWTQTFEKLSLWRPILTAFKYSIYPMVLTCAILLTTNVMEPIPKKWFIALLIPEAVVIPLYFTSHWTHLIYSYTDSNSYVAGPLRYLPYIIFFVYLAVFLTLNIIRLRYFSIKNRIIAMYICLVSILCVVLYLIFDKTDDYNPIFVSALVFYFLFLYIHQASIDPLTGLLNRQSFYQDILEKKNQVTFVASIDMNDLKQINDNLGHSYGDLALEKVSTIIKNAAGRKGSCYRIGGDEFMILFLYSNKEEVEKKIAIMKEEMNKTIYSCAFGYVNSNEYPSLDEAVKEADKLMYEDKARIKGL